MNEPEGKKTTIRRYLGNITKYKHIIKLTLVVWDRIHNTYEQAQEEHF